MPNSVVSGRLRLQIFFFAMLFSLTLYWVVAAQVAPASAHLDPRLKSLFTAVAALAAIAVYYVRFVRLERLLAAANRKPASVPWPNLRRAYVICYILCELVGLCGCVVYVMGAGRRTSALFFLSAASLYLFCYPRLPEGSSS
jgi:hypothetical protein